MSSPSRQRAIPFPFAGVALALAFAVHASAAPAQLSHSRNYLGVDAGLSFDRSAFSVRSGIGLSAGGLVGRQVGQHAAAEVRFGFEHFGAPERIISPGGCLGTVPCVLPTPERIQIAALDLDMVASGSFGHAVPYMLIGAGGRYVNAHPGRSEVRPAVELGAGLGIPIGGPTVSIEVRYQLAKSNAELPGWTLPLALAIRF